jgi:hypothetical protein
LREEATKPAIFSAREKMLGTLDLSIERLSERIEAGGDAVPLGTLLETIDILAKRTGHGEAKGPSVETNNTLVLVTKDELAESRARMRGVARSAPLALEASVEEASPPTPALRPL